MNRPLSLVTTESVVFRSTLVMVTVTPGSTPPDESLDVSANAAVDRLRHRRRRNGERDQQRNDCKPR